MACMESDIEKVRNLPTYKIIFLAKRIKTALIHIVETHLL